MKKYFCDYCGREVDYPSDISKLVVLSQPELGTVEETDDFGDLCQDCLKKVWKCCEELKNENP